MFIPPIEQEGVRGEHVRAVALQSDSPSVVASALAAAAHVIELPATQAPNAQPQVGEGFFRMLQATAAALPESDYRPKLGG